MVNSELSRMLYRGEYRSLAKPCGARSSSSNRKFPQFLGPREGKKKRLRREVHGQIRRQMRRLFFDVKICKRSRLNVWSHKKMPLSSFFAHIANVSSRMFRISVRKVRL